jgi:hypothetical protein
VKAPTKGQRYRLPEQLGGGEVEYLWASQIGYRQNWIVTVPGGGPQFDIHPNWLTEIKLEEIKPELPAEPEPGAYLIGEDLGLSKGYGEWRVPSLETPGIYRFMWHTVWEKLGRPGVSIVPLVPKVDLPAVTLPWGHVDEDGDNVRIDHHGNDGVSLSVMQMNTSRAMYLDTPEARLGAAAAILAGHKAIEEAGRG